MRRDIEFNAEGTILRGWLYLPENPAGRVHVETGDHFEEEGLSRSRWAH